MWRYSPVLCSTMPSAGSQRPWPLAGIEAQDSDVAGAPGTVTLEDFNRRRLPGAVGAKEAEDLAAGDGELDSAHGFELAVRLAQTFDLNRVVIAHIGDDASGRNGDIPPAWVPSSRSPPFGGC